MEARNFDTWDEMNAWEKELEERIADQVGELPNHLAEDVFISEHSGEWALAGLQLLRYAFAQGIHVDANLVKPAIDFWGNQFFPTPYSFLFAGRWLSSKQIEEIFEFGIMPTPIMPAHPEQDTDQTNDRASELAPANH